MTPLLGRAGVVIASALATSTCGMEIAARPTPFEAACCGTGIGEGAGGLWLTIGEAASEGCVDWDREGGGGCDGDEWCCCELVVDIVGGRIPPPEDILI